MHLSALVGRGGDLGGKCAGLCSTGAVSAGVQSPQWAHERNLSACRAAQLLKVLVLYVTVYGYLQSKDPLRLFNANGGYTWSQASFLSILAKYAKKGTLIKKKNKTNLSALRHLWQVLVIFDQVHKNWVNISSEFRAESGKSQEWPGLFSLYRGHQKTNEDLPTSVGQKDFRA